MGELRSEKLKVKNMGGRCGRQQKYAKYPAIFSFSFFVLLECFGHATDGELRSEKLKAKNTGGLRPPAEVYQVSGHF